MAKFGNADTIVKIRKLTKCITIRVITKQGGKII